MSAPPFKLIAELERDIRNQVVIDRMKRLTTKGKFMVFVHRHIWRLTILAAFSWAIFWCFVIVKVNAEEAIPTGPSIVTPLRVQCPTPGEPCKILFLTPAEEQMLTQRNGVLDTAAQGRSLDLGQFVVYFKTRLASAPSGEIKPVPAAQGNPDKGAGPMIPADKPVP